MDQKFYLKLPAKSGLLTIVLLFAFWFANAQVVWKNSIVGTSTSTNGRAPQASHKYTRTLYLVSEAELTAGGVDAGKVLKAIGFNYRAAEAVPASTASGNLKIYLQNTTDASYAKGTSWATAISTMTKVSDATETIPGATTADFTFSNGSAFTYTGNAIYVAFEWLNPEGALGTANTAYCNSSTTNTGGANGLYTSYSATVAEASDAITSNSAFRPATRFAYEVLNNDAKVSKIYAMTTAPVTEGKQVIATRVTNEGATPLANISVTLAITGANTFASTKTVSLPVETALATGEGVNIAFDEFIPTVAGTNIITVTMNNADDDLTNNTETFTQEVVSGLFSYNLGDVITSNGGSTIQDYKYAVKYTANGIVYPRAARFLLSTNSTVVGQQLKANWYNSNWELMGESQIYTALAADQGKPVTLNFDQRNVAVPNVGGSTDFYISIQLVSMPPDDPASNTTPKAKLAVFFMGRQNELENPAMVGTYFAGVTVTPITGLSVSTSKPTIEAITTTSTLPVTVSSFTANASNNKVGLKWEVGTESNVNRYEIERSEKNGAFTKVAAVNAAGTSSYTAVDSSPLAGDNYYRLKTVDNDGSSSYYGEIRVVKIATLTTSSFAIYPNPIVSDEINITLNNYTKGVYSYQVVDMTGRVLQQGKVNNDGASKHTISLNGVVGKGAYILSLTNGKEVMQTKFIKN